MQCFLAAFDQGHRSESGSYWSWHHPSIPLKTLDNLYYEHAAKHWSPLTERLSPGRVCGGCAGLGEQWVSWYRLVDGGRDREGRPGRFVLLAAFVKREEHCGRDWSGVLESPQFLALASQARNACPVPAPAELEMDWEPPKALAESSAAHRLRGAGRETCDLSNGLQLAAAVCSATMHSEDFDCLIVNEEADAHVTFTVCEEPRPLHFYGPQIADPIGIEAAAEPDTPRRTSSQQIAQSTPRLLGRVRKKNESLATKLVQAFLLGAAVGVMVGWQLRKLLE